MPSALRTLLILATAVPIACAAQLKVLVAVDPSEPGSGFVSTEEISSGLGRVSGKAVRAISTENLGDAMRSTRNAEYDVYVAPAHVSASALGHGYELVGSTQGLQRYVFVTRSDIQAVDALKDRSLYLSQQDSMASYIAKGMLNEAGLSLRTLRSVAYRKTTGAGLFAVGVGTVDATVAPEAEASQWLEANPGKGRVILRSQPVPMGMTVLVRKSMPEPVKSKVVAWFSSGETVMPGIGKIAVRHEPGPYKYVASLGHFTPAQLPGVTRVGAAEVQKLIAAGAQMVDVRSEREYLEGHIPGARLVPYGEKSLKDIAFDPRADNFPGVDKLDKSRPVIFACNGAECWKSYKASKAAVERGFKEVYWFRGGLPEWREQGLPVDAGAARKAA